VLVVDGVQRTSLMTFRVKKSIKTIKQKASKTYLSLSKKVNNSYNKKEDKNNKKINPDW